MLSILGKISADNTLKFSFYFSGKKKKDFNISSIKFQVACHKNMDKACLTSTCNVQLFRTFQMYYFSS